MDGLYFMFINLYIKKSKIAESCLHSKNLPEADIGTQQIWVIKPLKWLSD